MTYNEEQQSEIDHVIVWEVMHAQQKARGFEEELHVGDTVNDFRIPTADGVGLLVSGAVVETRHQAAIAHFRANYPLGCEIGSVRLRVEPPSRNPVYKQCRRSKVERS